jgi:hypothetical protein
METVLDIPLVLTPTLSVGVWELTIDIQKLAQLIPSIFWPRYSSVDVRVGTFQIQQKLNTVKKMLCLMSLHLMFEHHQP